MHRCPTRALSDGCPASRRPTRLLKARGRRATPPTQRKVPTLTPGRRSATRKERNGADNTALFLFLFRSHDVKVEPCRVRKRRFESQFEDLQQHYLRMRQKQLVSAERSRSADPSKFPGVHENRAALDCAPSAHLANVEANAPAAVASNAARADGSGAVGPVEMDDLQEFSRMLAMFTHTSKLRVSCCALNVSRISNLALHASEMAAS